MVEFDNVVFRYPGSERPLLDGLSVTLRAGENPRARHDHGADLAPALHGPAGRTVLLRDGRVAEDGTHDELMALGGEYAGCAAT